jgi:hypothetical protein
MGPRLTPNNMLRVTKLTEKLKKTRSCTMTRVYQQEIDRILKPIREYEDQFRWKGPYQQTTLI